MHAHAPLSIRLAFGLAIAASAFTPWSSAQSASPPISIDGDLSDWPANRSALADRDFFYFRLGVGQPEATLQASTEPLTLMVDIDSSGKTGQKPDASAPAAAKDFGADLIVQFSPQSASSSDGPGRGVKAYEIDRRGTKRELPRNQSTIVFGPAYASDWFEIRLARGSFTSSGRGRVMSVLRDAGGGVIGWSEPEVFDVPAGQGTPALLDAMIPEKPADAIRIVSFNVLRASPMQTPAPFARVLSLLKPDAVLVQEWTDSSAKQIEGWFNASVPTTLEGSTGWHALMGQGWGVAVVSQAPIELIGSDNLLIAGDTKNTNAVRAIAGVTQTSIGPVLLGSLHLKSRGTKNSPEDARRKAEVSLFNESIRAALASGNAEAPIRIFGGDMNLVGSRPPIDLLRAGIDADDSEMTIASPRVLGDGSAYTWADPKADFSPGRLDYLLYSDATCEVVNEFILDASRLSDATLAKLGLDRSDTRISDHLPVVIDIRKK